MWTAFLAVIAVNIYGISSYRLERPYLNRDGVHQDDNVDFNKVLHQLYSLRHDVASLRTAADPSVYDNNEIASSIDVVGRPSYNSFDSRRAYHDRDVRLPLYMPKLPRNGELFEEDMIMDNRLRDAVLGRQSKKSAIDAPSMMWPNGVVPYIIADDFVAKDLLKEAIAKYHKHTCIRLRPKIDSDEDWVVFNSKKDICASNVGRQGGEQEVTLGKDCRIIGTVLHEIMHVLGFIHEHSRPDRDAHIDIKWPNIKKDDQANFNKYEVGEIRDLNVPYNFNSVMHYRNDAFSKNGKDTIVARDDPSMEFGQRRKWSKGDVDGINRLYNCKINDPARYDGLLQDYAGPSRRHDTYRFQRPWQ